MPIYEHECPDCKRRDERIAKASDPHPRCDVCKTEMKRLVSQSSFALKGGGWAADGYGAKSLS